MNAQTRQTEALVRTRERARGGNGNRGIWKRVPSTRVLSRGPRWHYWIKYTRVSDRGDKRAAATKLVIRNWPDERGIISGSVVVIRSGQLIDFYLAARSNYRLGFSCMDYRICVVDEQLVEIGRKISSFFSFEIKLTQIFTNRMNNLWERRIYYIYINFSV